MYAVPALRNGRIIALPSVCSTCGLHVFFSHDGEYKGRPVRWVTCAGGHSEPQITLANDFAPVPGVELEGYMADTSQEAWQDGLLAAQLLITLRQAG